MNDLKNLMDSLGLEKQIGLDEMPGIDLYMDQVIQLFENKYGDTKRNKDDKILTKTMINNYAKDGLFFPIKKKKYTRNHLILISLIYQLKGSLSITDIKGVLSGLNEKVMAGEIDLESFYSSYLALQAQNTREFVGELERCNKAVEAEAEKNAAAKDLDKVLLIASLVNMSTMFRRMAEKLADQLEEEKSK